MEISVFTRQQNPTTDLASHRGTRTVVNLVLASRLANRVGQNAIQLLSDATWKEVKTAARLRMHGIHATLGSCKTYQHRLEPKLERFTAANNAYIAYLEGFGPMSVSKC